MINLAAEQTTQARMPESNGLKVVGVLLLAAAIVVGALALTHKSDKPTAKAPATQSEQR